MWVGLSPKSLHVEAVAATASVVIVTVGLEEPISRAGQEHFQAVFFAK